MMSVVKKVPSLLDQPEFGQGDVSSFYTCDEGLSALTQEGQATLERLEGMLAQSVAQQYHMAGVQTEQSQAEFQGGNGAVNLLGSVLIDFYRCKICNPAGMKLTNILPSTRRLNICHSLTFLFD